jgi:phosphatidate cytidylyltransferase
VVLAIALAADIGALYVGLAIGKHRLAPSVSPGKTVEGFVGGVAASVLVTLAFRATCDVAPPATEGAANMYGLVGSLGSQLAPILGRLNYSQVLVFAGVTSILAQMGDLFESILKRSAQVKDSSGLIPGMGGVLDAVDGDIFAGPAAWFLLTFVWEVV